MVTTRAGITVLAGGVGASRFLSGLVPYIGKTTGEDINVIGNTGDDFTHFGLRISPDLDIVTYTLSGKVNSKTGWGFAQDTNECLTQLRTYAGENATWFNLGDRDIATHIYRTTRLAEGATLSRVTAEICSALDCPVNLIPMTNDEVASQVKTSKGWIHFEEYLVKHGARPRITGVRLKGADTARPAPGVLGAIRRSRAIIFPPSNPLVSIGTILSIRGVRKAIEAKKTPVVAVSPIVGGKPVKGPADKMMRGVGISPSVLGIAKHYYGLVDALIIDKADAGHANKIEAFGYRVYVMDTIMKTPAIKRALAKRVLEIIDELS